MKLFGCIIIGVGLLMSLWCATSVQLLPLDDPDRTLLWVWLIPLSTVLSGIVLIWIDKKGKVTVELQVDKPFEPSGTNERSNTDTLEQSVATESYIFEPKIACGPYRFGMSQADVDAITNEDNKISFEFNKDELFRIELYAEPKHLIFQNIDLLGLPCLDAALLVAKHSNKYGQAQGGSLYFDDLGLAILQFETPELRTFVFYNAAHNEPLRTIDSDDIREYYHDQF